MLHLQWFQKPKTYSNTLGIFEISIQIPRGVLNQFKNVVGMDKKLSFQQSFLLLQNTCDGNIDNTLHMLEIKWGFPIIDHSGSVVKIVLEQKKIQQKSYI